MILTICMIRKHSMPSTLTMDDYATDQLLGRLLATAVATYLSLTRRLDGGGIAKNCQSILNSFINRGLTKM